MQFDWAKFQQRLKALQFQRSDFRAQKRHGELHAKLGVGSTAMRTRAEHDTCGIAVGTGRHARGRQALAGQRGDTPSEARSADGSRAGRRPPPHTAAGPSGTRNTSGATSTPVETFFAPACGSSTPVETFFAPTWGASTLVEIFFAHAHPKWLIFDHFHRAGEIFLSQRHPERPPGATQGRSFFHAAPSGPQREPAALPSRGARRWRRGLAGQRGDTPNHTPAHQAPLAWRAPEGPEDSTSSGRFNPIRRG